MLVEVRHIRFLRERVVVEVRKEGDASSCFYEIPDRAPAAWIYLMDLCIGLLEKPNVMVVNCGLTSISKPRWGGALLARYDEYGLEVVELRPGKGLVERFSRYYPA